MAYKINTTNGDSCIIILKSRIGKAYFKNLDGYKKESGREAIVTTKNLNDVYTFSSFQMAQVAADKLNEMKLPDTSIEIVCYNYERAEILENKLDRFLGKTQEILDAVIGRNQPKQFFAVSFRFNQNLWYYNSPVLSSTLDNAFIFTSEERADEIIKQLGKEFGSSYSSIEKIIFNVTKQAE